MKLNVGKFSFAEMTSNSTGKTSGSGAMGVYIVVMSVLAFLFGCIEFHYSGKADIMMYSSANILVGAGLLGYRKSKGNNIPQNGSNDAPSVNSEGDNGTTPS